MLKRCQSAPNLIDFQAEPSREVFSERSVQCFSRLKDLRSNEWLVILAGGCMRISCSMVGAMLARLSLQDLDAVKQINWRAYYKSLSKKPHKGNSYTG